MGAHSDPKHWARFSRINMQDSRGTFKVAIAESEEGIFEHVQVGECIMQ